MCVEKNPPGQVTSKNACRARGMILPAVGGNAVAMKIDLSGRTAVITGASRGLGEAMAKALAEAGAQVALVARDVKRLESVRDAISRAGRDGGPIYWRRDAGRGRGCGGPSRHRSALAMRKS